MRRAGGMMVGLLVALCVQAQPVHAKGVDIINGVGLIDYGNVDPHAFQMIATLTTPGSRTFLPRHRIHIAVPQRYP